MKITIQKAQIFAVLCSSLFIISCATTPAQLQQPDEQISNIKKIISLVKRYPQAQDIAGIELQYAENNLKQAEQELNSGNSAKAQLFLDMARSDAEYAKSKVRVGIYLNQAREKENLLKNIKKTKKKTAE